MAFCDEAYDFGRQAAGGKAGATRSAPLDEALDLRPTPATASGIAGGRRASAVGRSDGAGCAWRRSPPASAPSARNSAASAARRGATPAARSAPSSTVALLAHRRASCRRSKDFTLRRAALDQKSSVFSQRDDFLRERLPGSPSAPRGCRADRSPGPSATDALGRPGLAGARGEGRAACSPSSMARRPLLVADAGEKVVGEAGDQAFDIAAVLGLGDRQPGAAKTAATSSTCKPKASVGSRRPTAAGRRRRRPPPARHERRRAAAMHRVRARRRCRTATRSRRRARRSPAAAPDFTSPSDALGSKAKRLVARLPRSAR